MRLLLVGNDHNYQSFLSRKLTETVTQIKCCVTLEEAGELLQSSRYEAVICCLPLLNRSCPYEVLDQLKKWAENAALILISDNLQLHTAMELMREGLFSCFNRPFPLDQLMDTLRQIKGKEQLPVETGANEKPASERVMLRANHHVRGTSSVALDMYKKMELVGPTNFSVIVYGETGTGKESVAGEIAKARNPAAPYIAVDCGCLSKELALSELFGHEKGSFTGAVARKIGAFELANRGTLFLDEIGNLDYEVQGYLLRALQEKKIKRVGGTEDIPVNTRIIVASNEHLATAVKMGKFREDLYHRLNEFEITVPPLRSRTDDLRLLIDHFVTEANSELGKHILGPDEDALYALTHYSWHGNIRELKNVIRRASLLCTDGGYINVDCLPHEIIHFEDEVWETEIGDTAVVIKQKKPRDITIEEVKAALKMNNYNKTKAAHYLGIDRKTLYNRLKESNNLD